jgi:hypothetical protein
MVMVKGDYQMQGQSGIELKWQSPVPPRYQMGMVHGYLYAVFHLGRRDHLASVRERGDTYDLLTVYPDGWSAIRCDICRLISFNSQDVFNRYCSHCHFFHAK